MLKAKKIITITVIVVLLSVIFVAIPVSASSNIYTVDFQKPSVNNYSSYLEVLYQKPDGQKTVLIYSFVLCGVDGDTTTNTKIPLSLEVRANVTSDNISLTAICPYTGQATFCITWLRADTMIYDVYSYNSLPVGINLFHEANWKILSVKGYGGVKYNAFDNGINDFTVVYGENSAIYNILKGVEIASNNQTDELKSNDDKNTQAIIDNQNQIQQNEKNETQTQGQTSVDDLSGAVDDKSSGFVTSIRNLVSAMSYNGTECAWSFPEVKLPAISGVMSETKLIDSQPIDFAYWVNKIPANILLVVRSLLTIGLIVYCFKELYSTISYVLTLKGGGDSE